MSVCRGGMRGPGVHCECVKKQLSFVLCCRCACEVGRDMWCGAASRVCRLSDLVVSPGLLSLSDDLTTRRVAIYAYTHICICITILIMIIIIIISNSAFLYCFHTHTHTYTNTRTHRHTYTYTHIHT